MADEKMMRLSQVARKLNVGKNTIIEALEDKGFEVENSPNAKISMEQFNMLAKEFESSAMDREEASGLTIGKKHADNFVIDQDHSEEVAGKEEEEEIFIKGISVETSATTGTEESKEKEGSSQTPAKEQEEQEEQLTSSPKLKGIKVVGKIELENKKEAEAETEKQEAAEPVAEKEEEKKTGKVEEATPEDTIEDIEEEIGRAHV